MLNERVGAGSYGPGSMRNEAALMVLKPWSILLVGAVVVVVALP